MKQLEHEIVRAELDNRHDGGMAETAVGLAHHARELAQRDRISDEWTNHFEGDFGIEPAGKLGDSLLRHSRPALGHIKPAVAREPRERDLDKIERRSFAAG